MMTRMPMMSRMAQPNSMPTAQEMQTAEQARAVKKKEPEVTEKFNPAKNLGAYHHPAKIGPNTTAPAKARAVTAGPNGSFPIGDHKHAVLAEQMAPKSYNAGNISKSQEEAIIAKAKVAADRAPKPEYVAKMKATL